MCLLDVKVGDLEVLQKEGVSDLSACVSRTRVCWPVVENIGCALFPLDSSHFFWHKIYGISSFIFFSCQ